MPNLKGLKVRFDPEVLRKIDEILIAKKKDTPYMGHPKSEYIRQAVSAQVNKDWEPPLLAAALRNADEAMLQASARKTAARKAKRTHVDHKKTPAAAKYHRHYKTGRSRAA